MNWEAIGAIGELLGAFFVFITLIYLSFQIRSNSKMLISQNIHSSTQHMQDLMSLQVHPDVITASIKGEEGKDLDLKDSLVLEAYAVSMMFTYWNRYEHHKQGLSSMLSWEDSRKSMADYLAIPWLKNWWGEYGSKRFSEDFVHEVNLLIAEESSDPNYHQRLVKKLQF